MLIATDDGGQLLVDTGPDLRAQALLHDIRRVDGILFTHGHADHIFGLDEVRRYNSLQQRPMVCYGDERTLADIRRDVRLRVRRRRRRPAAAFPRSSCSDRRARSAWAGQEVQPVR